MLHIAIICNYTAQCIYISHKLETGSLVQFGDPVQYGVITKIKTEVGTSREVAEVETVSYICT